MNCDVLISISLTLLLDLKPVSIDDSSTDDKKASLSDAEVIAEEKRMKLRRALANRLKTDLLIESLDNITSISPKNIGGTGWLKYEICFEEHYVFICCFICLIIGKMHCRSND